MKSLPIVVSAFFARALLVSITFTPLISYYVLARAERFR